MRRFRATAQCCAKAIFCKQKPVTVSAYVPVPPDTDGKNVSQGVPGDSHDLSHAMTKGGQTFPIFFLAIRPTAIRTTNINAALWQPVVFMRRENVTISLGPKDRSD